jgi:dihydrofolate reductase
MLPSPSRAPSRHRSTATVTFASGGWLDLVHALLQHDLVDELFLHVYPIALGQGKRVFPDRIDAKFKLASAHPYPTGVVGLSYIKA